MKKITFFLFIFFLLLASTQIFGFEGVCDKYFKGNPEKALQRLKANPSPEAQLCVGAMFYEGRGTEKNVAEAVKWIKKSAVQGNPIAQTNLGVFFLKGEGVKLDSGKAYDWFLKASQQNYPRAQYFLGGLYYEGNGTSRDIIEAIKWFKNSANYNFELAQEALQTVLPVVSWRKEVNDFKGVLLLMDKSKNQYPNETHIKSNIEKSNYLALKTGDEFTAAVGISGCNKDRNGHCNETASIGLFAPDWSLIYEAHDVKFEFNKEDFGIINDYGETFYIFIILSIEPNDPSGQYRLVSIIKDDNKPKLELNQIFWVQDK